MDERGDDIAHYICDQSVIRITNRDGTSPIWLVRAILWEEEKVGVVERPITVASGGHVFVVFEKKRGWSLMKMAIDREGDSIGARRGVSRSSHHPVKMFDLDGRDVALYLFFVAGNKFLYRWGGGIRLVPDRFPLPLEQTGHGFGFVHPFPFGGDKVAEVPFPTWEDLLRLAKEVRHTPLSRNEGLCL